VYRLKAELLSKKIKSVHVNISESVKNKIDRFGKEIVENILLYSSIHTLDLAMFIVGDKIDIHSSFVSPSPETGFENINALGVTRGKNIPISISINEDNPVNTEITVLTDDGTRYHLSPLEKLTICDELTVETVDGKRKYVPNIKTIITADDEVCKAGILRQMKVFTSGNNSKYLGKILDELELRRLIVALKNKHGYI
jgi:hypothetical protein